MTSLIAWMSSVACVTFMISFVGGGGNDMFEAIVGGTVVRYLRAVTMVYFTCLLEQHSKARQNNLLNQCVDVATKSLTVPFLSSVKLCDRS